MFAAILFSILFISTEEARYKEPMMKSFEASYAKSEVKDLVDSATDKAKKEYPVLTSIVPVGYAIGIKREVRLISGKLLPIAETQTTLQYNQRNQSGSIGVTWHY